ATKTEGTVLHEPATRSATPLVWVTDGKEHIRRFLRETLSEFRFVIEERVEAAELSAALDARAPDLVVIGLTAGATEACDMLQALADKDSRGKFCRLLRATRQWSPRCR